MVKSILPELAKTSVGAQHVEAVVIAELKLMRKAATKRFGAAFLRELFKPRYFSDYLPRLLSGGRKDGITNFEVKTIEWLQAILKGHLSPDAHVRSGHEENFKEFSGWLKTNLKNRKQLVELLRSLWTAEENISTELRWRAAEDECHTAGSIALPVVSQNIGDFPDFVKIVTSRVDVTTVSIDIYADCGDPASYIDWEIFISYFDALRKAASRSKNPVKVRLLIVRDGRAMSKMSPYFDHSKWKGDPLFKQRLGAYLERLKPLSAFFRDEYDSVVDVFVSGDDVASSECARRLFELQRRFHDFVLGKFADAGIEALVHLSGSPVIDLSYFWIFDGLDGVFAQSTFGKYAKARHVSDPEVISDALNSFNRAWDSVKESVGQYWPP